MNNNFGNTLKVIAIILGILCVIGSIVLGIIVGNNTNIDGLGLGVTVGSMVSCFITVLVLYGFGDLIDNTAALRYENTELRHDIKRQLADIRSILEKETDSAPTDNKKAEAAPAKKIEKIPVLTQPLDVEPEEMAQFEYLETAADIYNLFSTLNKDSEDESAAIMLDRLKKAADSEAQYGNSKFAVLPLLRGYYRHGRHIFIADRSERVTKCPACGKAINSSRSMCFNCNALFRD